MRGKSPSGLKCPYCRVSIMDVHVEFNTANSFEYSQANKTWLMYSLCPDQGEVQFKCGDCQKVVTVASPDPNDWDQEMLNDMNGG